MITKDSQKMLIVKQDSNYCTGDMQLENNVHLRPDPPGVGFTSYIYMYTVWPEILAGNLIWQFGG